MDIAKLSMGMSQMNVGTEIGAKMLSMNLDTIEQMGSAMIDTMNSMPSPSLESLVNPAVGGHIDLAV